MLVPVLKKAKGASIIKKIRKRDGRVVDFDQDKIAEAIWKAAKEVGGKDRQLAGKLAAEVVERLEKHLKPREIPSVEQVQDLVEVTLIDKGHARTAKAYILYRQKRAEIRKAKTMLGIVDELKLPLNSILVLERRYLQKDENGKVRAFPSGWFVDMIYYNKEIFDKEGLKGSDIPTKWDDFIKLAQQGIRKDDDLPAYCR